MLNTSDTVRSTQTIDGRILLDVRHGRMFSVNAVGSKILELLEQGQDEPRIADEISRAYGPTVWEQPLYMVLKRDGTYLCGTCVLQHGVLSIRPQSEQAYSPIELRNGIDAEVIGQVTATLRRLS